MPNTSGTDALPARDLAYFSQRFRHRVFAVLVSRFAALAEQGMISKTALARKIGKDQGQVTRLLAMPSNMTIDTVSELALALGCEADIVLHGLDERNTDNFVHPLMDDHRSTAIDSARRASSGSSMPIIHTTLITDAAI